MRDGGTLRGSLVAALALLVASGCESHHDPLDEDGSALRRGPARAGLRVLPDRVVITEGETRTLYVALTAPPRHAVSVQLTSSDASEATVAPARLHFSRATWWLPQRVEVTGATDLVLDGDVRFDVRAQARSRDAAYDGLQARVRGTTRDAARFHGLGDPTRGVAFRGVEALSTSGEVAVGVGDGDAPGAARWSPASGSTLLAGDHGVARGVSPDGSLIVGTVADARWAGGRAAVLWPTPDALPALFHEPLVPPIAEPLWFVDAAAVTDGGDVYGDCVQYGAYGDRLACRTPIGLSNLLLPTSRIFGVTRDATSFVGTREPSRHTTQRTFGSVATLNRTPLGYPADAVCIVPHECESEARAASASAAVVVGTSFVPAPGEWSTSAPLAPAAFVYTAAEGMLRLPGLAGGEGEGGAYAVSDDGACIAGFAVDALGQQATLWIDRQPVRAVDLLVAAHATVPDGWQLTVVRALSSDGRTLAGNGINPAGEYEAWRALLPDPRAALARLQEGGEARTLTPPSRGTRSTRSPAAYAQR